MIVAFNIDDGKDYLNNLNKFREELILEKVNLLNKWNNLKNSWTDDNFREFELQFEALTHHYVMIENIYDNFSNHTKGLISHLEDHISVLPILS